MRRAILFAAVFLFPGGSVFPQGQRQSAAPSTRGQASQQQPAKSTASPADTAASPAAAAGTKSADSKDAKSPATPSAAAGANAELDKLKAEQARREAEQQEIQKAREVVHEWFRRWNGLDENEASAGRFADLYSPDAVHITGPQDDLIGTAFYQTRPMILELARKSGKMYCRQAFYIKMRTSMNLVADDGGAKTTELLTAAVSPLGGVSVVVELGASYDYRETKKRFMAAGAAFFDIKDGKITRSRMYYSKGEHFEVTNQPGCSN